jgi:hypothetical protein
MLKRSSKKPKEDFTQLAYRLVQELTAEKPAKDQAEAVSAALDDETVRKQVMREMGSRGGKKGGTARAAKLTPAERSEIAKRAAAKRWSNKES